MIQTKQGIKKSKRAQLLLFLKRLKGYTDITVSNSCDNSLCRVMLELMDSSPLHTEHWSCALGAACCQAQLWLPCTVYHRLILLYLSESSSEGSPPSPFLVLPRQRNACPCLLYGISPVSAPDTKWPFLTQRCCKMRKRGLSLSPLIAWVWIVKVTNLY